MFYRPVVANRWFKQDVRYSDVDWSRLEKVVSAFEARIREWYVEPARELQAASGHFAFPVLALCCLLLDTLSQFYYGKEHSSRRTFMDFVRAQLPTYGGALPISIRRPAGSSPSSFTELAEVLYFGFRCGILHEAHVPAYGAISGLPAPFQIEHSGIAEYSDGTSCPVVIIDPHQLLDVLDGFLRQYVLDLLDSDPTCDSLRAAFKTKFTSSFGVDISGAH